MDIVFLLTIALIVILAIAFVQLFAKQKLLKAEPQVNLNEEEVQEVNPRRRLLAANRNARSRQRIHEQGENEEEMGAPDIPDIPEGKIGAKKLAKLQAKAEKKAQRENEEKLRQEKLKIKELAEEERRKLELKEKEEEQRRKEQERKKKEEKEKQEYEEYLKLKETFSVQEEGWEESGEHVESQLQDFINHIKASKIVILEDLAAQFKLKTQDVINRINNLQADNQLTGVIDDRGKFIYISEDELEAVAKFLKQRGRVSIAELVENSNILINLTPAVNVTD